MSSPLRNNITNLQNLLEQVNALPEAVEQVAPSISVNASGLITATAGTKSSTHQLAFQPAKTITPSTTSQIAVSSGYYTGGDVIVAGDSNLVPENIKKDVSIFGVTGTMETGSKTVSVIVENTTVYGFDADGNPITATNGTYDFLSGIIFVRNITNTSFSGNFIIHSTYGSLVVFLSDGGTIYRESTGGGGAN